MSIAPTATPGGSRKSLRAAAGGGSGGSWWAPIFGWSGEPDYIDGAATEAAPEELQKPGPGQRPRFAAFTEEKARKLRMKAMETESFHDVMYHSAIASRLASDVPRRSRN